MSAAPEGQLGTVTRESARDVTERSRWSEELAVAVEAARQRSPSTDMNSSDTANPLADGAHQAHRCAHSRGSCPVRNYVPCSGQQLRLAGEHDKQKHTGCSVQPYQARGGARRRGGGPPSGSARGSAAVINHSARGTKASRATGIWTGSRGRTERSSALGGTLPSTWMSSWTL